MKLNNITVIMAIFFMALSTSFAADKPGTTRIAKWKDDKACAFILMFDDSAQSHVKNVFPELSKRGMTGTFYINPGSGQYGAHRDIWEKKIPAAGFELANHTLTHRGGMTKADIEQEVSACNEAIHKCTPNLPWPRLISYGQPGGIKKENWPMSKDELAKVLVENNLIDRPDFGSRGANIAMKTGAQMLAHVDKSIKDGSMECIIFHGVGGDWIAVPMSAFTELLDGLEKRKDKVWLTQHIAAHQYTVERESTEVEVSKTAAAKITLSLKSKADPKFYDQPLTLITAVPSDWKKCTVQQGGSSVEVAVKEGVILYDAVPGKGPVQISKK